MKTGTLKFSLLLVAALAVAWIVQAGSLEPPGPPAPTMKPLDAVEPRTPLSNAAFSIPAAGSYYLTQNVTTASSLSITVDDVTLDLNGFGIRAGGTPTVPAIEIDAAVNVVIKNGSIRGFDHGVVLVSSAQAVLTDLRITGSTHDGVRVVSADVRVEGCDISDNGGYGINVLSDGVSYDFGTAEIFDNTIISNGLNGILADSAFLVIQGNRVRTNMGAGIEVSMADAQVLENTVTSNNGAGIAAALVGGGSILDNRCFSNGGLGISVADSSPEHQIARNVAANNIGGDYSIDPSASAATISTLSGSPGPWDNIALTVPSR